MPKPQADETGHDGGELIAIRLDPSTKAQLATQTVHCPDGFAATIANPSDPHLLAACYLPTGMSWRQRPPQAPSPLMARLVPAQMEVVATAYPPRLALPSAASAACRLHFPLQPSSRPPTAIQK